MPCCCLRSSGAGAGAASSAVPDTVSSFYQTSSGLVVLTWSRAVVGRSLRADVHLRDGVVTFTLRLSPWLFWRLKGSKTFVLHNHSTRLVQLSWDFTAARFPAAPEPAAGFALSLSVNWETVLVLGDSPPAAGLRKKGAAAGNRRAPLILRQDHVFGHRTFATEARFGGKSRELSVDCGNGEDARLLLRVDGERVLQVKKLKWKFRGSEKVVVDGVRVQVSWDVHNWLFNQPAGGSDSGDLRQALFMFRFEEKRIAGDGDAAGDDCYLGNGCDAKQAVIQQSMPCPEKKKMKSMNRRKRSLLQASSSSSSSSFSSASSSSVIDWASPEETELQSLPGFTLQVYARRKM